MANQYDPENANSDNLEDYIQTKISFDQGGQWFPLQQNTDDADAVSTPAPCIARNNNPRKTSICS